MAKRYQTIEEQIKRLNELSFTGNPRDGHATPIGHEDSIEVKTHGAQPLINLIQDLQQEGKSIESLAQTICSHLGLPPTEYDQDFSFFYEIVDDLKSGIAIEDVVKMWETRESDLAGEDAALEEQPQTLNTSTSGQYFTNDTELPEKDEDYNDWLMEMQRINKFLIIK